MTALTDDARRRFRRNGFVVIDDAIGEDRLEPAREAVWDGIESEDDPESLRGAGYEVNAATDIDDEPFERITDAAFPYADELVGGEVISDPSGVPQIALNFPDEYTEIPESEELHGHLDGYADFENDPTPSLFTVGTVVYLAPVEPRGGGFTVWPGSHRTATRFFQDYSLETAGASPDNASVASYHREADEFDFDRTLSQQYDPYEVTGDAGTLVLWHNKLTHTAGTNQSPNLRMAAINRFSRDDQDAVMRDAASRPWKYWPAMAEDPPGHEPDNATVP